MVNAVKGRPAARGFTLIEVLYALAIASMVLASLLVLELALLRKFSEAKVEARSAMELRQVAEWLAADARTARSVVGVGTTVVIEPVGAGKIVWSLADDGTTRRWFDAEGNLGRERRFQQVTMFQVVALGHWLDGSVGTRNGARRRISAWVRQGRR